MTKSDRQLPLFPSSRTFFDRYALWVLMIFGFMVPTVFLMARTAVQSHQNKVQDWLPKNYSETRDLVEFRKNFAGDQFIVVSWEGCRIGDDPLTVGAVQDDPRIQRLAGLLTGKVVGESIESLSGDEGPAMEEVERLRLESDLPEYFSSVTTARETLTRMTDGPHAMSYKTAVKRLTGSLIGADGHTSCLVVFLSDHALGKFREVLARPTSGWLRVLHPEGMLFRAMRAAGIDPEQAVIGGPPVDNVSIDQEGQRTLLRLAGLAGLLGLVLAWCSLRSIVLTGMVFTCGIVSAASSLAAVAIAGDHTDAILFSMPPLVYVLAMSGAVHLINYYRQAVIDHGEDLAAERALWMGWKPALLCSITTALGLLSLCTSDLTPIRKFGIFAALGVVMTLATLFLLLPAMLKLWSGCIRVPATVADKSQQASWSDRFWERLGRGIVRQYGWVLVASVLFIGVMGYGLTKIRSSVDLMKLFGPEARILHDYRWLESNIGRLVPMEIVLRVDHRCMTDEVQKQKDFEAGIPLRKTMSMLDRVELVRDVQREIERKFGAYGQDVVGPSMAVTTFVPAIPKKEKSASSIAKRTAFEVSMENNFADLKNSGYLQTDSATGDELWRISLRVAAFKDVDYGVFSHELKELVDPLVATSVAGVSGNVTAVQTTYTGVIPIVYKAQRSLLESLASSTWWSFASITPLLMLVSRGFLAGLVAMLPNILPVVVIFGAMGWMGVNIDIGSMMAASIALGVAVDDTIHYLTWFRHELNDTGCRHAAIIGAYRHCATPTLQAALINGMGLSVFAFSTFMPTRKFGYLMLTILVAGMVAELILLPALLASPLGRTFKPATKSAAAKKLRIAA